MAERVFRDIKKAIGSGEHELLRFPDLATEDSALVLESLLDPRNGLGGLAFRYVTSLAIKNSCLVI